MIDTQYEDLLQKVLDEGAEKSDRTGTGTLSVFGPQLEYDVSKTVPVITTKKVAWKTCLKELLWMMRGQTSAKILQSQNCHIWDAWAREDGSLGPIYGAQWRHALGGSKTVYCDDGTWSIIMNATIDQLQNAVDTLRTDPCSRRIIVDSWQVNALDSMALYPCHCLYQFWSDGARLSLKLYQRSADLPVGVPFNLFSYASLLHVIAHMTNLKPWKLIWSAGDAHIYLNQIEQVKKQLQNEVYEFPKLVLHPNEHMTLEDWSLDMFELKDYKHHDTIKYEVAV